MFLLIIASGFLTTTACLSGCKSFDAKMIGDVMTALNDAGATYSGTLEGPTKASAYAKQEFGVGTDGWLSFRIQGPISNPETGKLEPPTIVEIE